MPTGSFWPPLRRNTDGTASRPFRRRRSLLGRKNRSDNDLPSTTPLNPNHTTLINLPENVRTILIAGSPECWNMSTTAESYDVPECDVNSILTLGSELSPDSEALTNSLTIDEEESYHGSSKHQPQRDLDWLRAGGGRPSSPSDKNLQNEMKPSPIPNGPSSMVVMYKSPSNNPGSPQEALQIWLHSVDVLMKSKEMASLVTSTRDVVMVAGGLAVKTAFLPVTFPLHVACATRDFVGWTVHQALSQTGQMLHLTNGEEEQDSSSKPSSEESKPSSKPPLPQEEKEQSGGNPLEGLLQLVPAVLGAAGKVKDEIGSAVIGLVMPPQPRDDEKAAKDHDKEVLERLKIPELDTTRSKMVEMEAPAAVVISTPTHSGATKADFSKFLLRVDDLGVNVPGESNSAVVLYVDLSADFRDDALLATCLDKLAAQGIALATCHAPSIPPATTSADAQVEWKPEGATAKLLRKKARQTTERWEETIRSEVLIWSGNFKKGFGGSDIHSQYPTFVARGIVERLSPRNFLELLWNNERTEEYNNYCMGRKDAIQIDDKVLSSPDIHSGVKVVRSETRVPFTGLSVSLCTVMHCRALPGGPQEGYVIISRSLVSGMAGYHTTQYRSIQKGKSEILWGVNLLRSVPGHPGQTELTSVSQVASTMVPQFLSKRIGIMGVEDFFRSVRNSPKVASDSAPTSPTSASVKAAAPVSPASV